VGTVTVRAVALLALAALSAFGCSPGYTPVVRPGPNIPDTSYVPPAVTSGLHLLVFNTGMNRMSQSVVGDVRPWRPNPAFVIRHPTQGLIVFDTGWPAEVVERGEYSIPSLIESVNTRGRMLDEQMTEVGLNPADVLYVVVSHLHDDHIGRVAAFPNAVVIGGPSADAALAKLARTARRMTIDFSSRLAPFDETHDLFGDGSIVLVHGGGSLRGRHHGLARPSWWSGATRR
jgi:N-acyl homoserine lactone hydrolase